MYELSSTLSTVDALCSIAFKAFGIATSWYIIAALKRWKPGNQPEVKPQPKEVVKVEVAQAVPEPQTPVEAVIPTPAPVPAPVPVVPEEIIECGSCHQDIRSSPVTTMELGLESWNVYVCEHCSAQVKLPV